MQEREFLKDEYDEVCKSIRHHSAVIYSGVAVFATANALAARFFVEKLSLAKEHYVYLAIGMFCFSIIFLVVEFSTMYLWTYFMRRAVALERDLGYQHYCNLPGAPRFIWPRPGSIVMILFYFAGCIFWLWKALHHWLQ